MKDRHIMSGWMPQGSVPIRRLTKLRPKSTTTTKMKDSKPVTKTNII